MSKHVGFGRLLEVETSKKCTPLWREAHVEVSVKSVKKMPRPVDFWRLRCRKSAPRCGAKHISKSKCTNHHTFGPLLEVEMSKKCMPLWREAHFQAKCTNHRTFGPLLEVEMSKKCHRCGAKHISKSKMYKPPHVRATLGSPDVHQMSKKFTQLWRKAHFKAKSVKNWNFQPLFDDSMAI